MGKWFHHRGPSKGFHGHDRVQQGQRPNPSRVGGGDFEPDGSTDVAHQQVKAIKSQLVGGPLG
jgi:hypothetical protein